MNIIAKIDSEIARLHKEDDGIGSDIVPVIVGYLEKLKKELAGQKEPCEYCKNEIISANIISVRNAYAIKKNMVKPNFCPNCGRPIQPTTDTSPHQNVTEHADRQPYNETP